MNEQESLPILSVDLLTRLDREYPLITASSVVTLNEKQLAFAAGQRSVIERLLLLQEADNLTDV